MHLSIKKIIKNESSLTDVKQEPRSDLTDSVKNGEKYIKIRHIGAGVRQEKRNKPKSLIL